MLQHQERLQPPGPGPAAYSSKPGCSRHSSGHSGHSCRHSSSSASASPQAKCRPPHLHAAVLMQQLVAGQPPRRGALHQVQQRRKGRRLEPRAQLRAGHLHVHPSVQKLDAEGRLMGRQQARQLLMHALQRLLRPVGLGLGQREEDALLEDDWPVLGHLVAQLHQPAHDRDHGGAGSGAHAVVLQVHRVLLALDVDPVGVGGGSREG